jgi:hypothetical protein
MPKRSIARVLVVLFALTGCSVLKVQKLPAASIAQQPQLADATISK